MPLVSQRECYIFGVKNEDLNKIVEEIKKGNVVIAGFSNFRFTSYPHWIVIRGITLDNQFIINDPLYRWHQESKGKLSWQQFMDYSPKNFYSFKKLGATSGFFEEKTPIVYSSHSSPENNFLKGKIYLTKTGNPKPEAPSFYKITIENTTEGTYTRMLDNSEFLPPPCLLKSGATHRWRVQACCDTRGTNCGPATEAIFKTNLAPEPISPLDPDWAGPGKIENVKKENLGRLSWCQIEDSSFYQKTVLEGKTYYRPLSYKILIYYSEKDLCHPRLSNQGRCNPEILTPSSEDALLPPEFQDEYHLFFTKSTTYAWKVSACRDIYATECTDFSQLWRFSSENFTLPKPELIFPPNDQKTPIGIPVFLQWKSPYANSFIYDISGIIRGTTSEANITLDFPKISLDTLYNWKIKPCWDYEAKKCENFWSEIFYFKTTGAPPNLISPISDADNVPIPTTLKWEKVEGAKSYRVKIVGVTSDDGIISEKTEYIFGYPELKQKTTYSWQVKTCADRDGKICGKEWSNPESFTTFKLLSPSNPSLKDGEEIFTYQMPTNISWNPVPYAKAYKFTLSYLSKSPEETNECPTGKVEEKIVSNPSVFIYLNCLGKYEWRVFACLDEHCQETGESSPTWHFTLSQPKEIKKGGLLPCGMIADNPKTPWNERDPCEIKHIFIMVKTILDLLLGNLTPLILVLLLIITGVIFYFFSFESTVIGLIKSIWKAVGIGVGIILLSWTIITIFMSILGYKIGVYGPWWQITF